MGDECLEKNVIFSLCGARDPEAEETDRGSWVYFLMTGTHTISRLRPRPACSQTQSPHTARAHFARALHERPFAREMSAAANSSVRAPPTPSRTRRARRTALWKWQPGWHPASAALPETGHPPGTACVSIARQATTRSTSRPRAPPSRAARARVPRTSRYAPLAPRAPPPPAPDRSLSVRRVAEKISSPLDRSAGVLAHRRYVVPQVLQHVRRGRPRIPQGALFHQGAASVPLPLPQTHLPWNPRLRFPRSPRPDTTPPTLTTPPLAACTQAKAREAVYMKATKYIEGKKQPSVVTEVIPPGGK